MKIPSKKVRDYIRDNIEDNIKNDKLNFIALEEDTMCGFDVQDLDEIEDDLSFKIFNFVTKNFPQYME